MTTATNQYRPDYVVPPGRVLEEYLQVQGISYAELARRCGRSPELIREIIAGKAPLEPETALRFAKVLGVDASIWMGIEADYRLRRDTGDLGYLTRAGIVDRLGHQRPGSWRPRYADYCPTTVPASASHFSGAPR